MCSDYKEHTLQQRPSLYGLAVFIYYPFIANYFTKVVICLKPREISPLNLSTE